MKFEFSKPYKFEEKEFTEIEIDLESITGKEVSAAKKEWNRQGNYSPVITADLDFCMYLAAKAAKQPIEFVENLPAKDYCRMGQTISNFLLG